MKYFHGLRIAVAIVLTVAQTALRGDVSLPCEEPFRQDLQELLEALSKTQLLPQLDLEKEAEFLRKFMENLAIPAVITNLAEATDPEPAETSALLNLSANEGILYLRLKNFQQADSDRCAALAEDFKRQNGKGLVVDLRHAQGFSTDAEKTYLQFLQAFNGPMLILMDSETAGTPESIILELKKGHDVLTLGKPSLGLGGAGQEIKLKSGLTLRVPHLEKDQLPGPLEPDITLRKNPAPADPALDPWCQHARDTLKLILTLE